MSQIGGEGRGSTTLGQSPKIYAFLFWRHPLGKWKKAREAEFVVVLPIWLITVFTIFNDDFWPCCSSLIFIWFSFSSIQWYQGIYNSWHIKVSQMKIIQFYVEHTSLPTCDYFISDIYVFLLPLKQSFCLLYRMVIMMTKIKKIKRRLMVTLMTAVIERASGNRRCEHD